MQKVEGIRYPRSLSLLVTLTMANHRRSYSYYSLWGIFLAVVSIGGRELQSDGTAPGGLGPRTTDAGSRRAPLAVAGGHLPAEQNQADDHGW